MCQFTLYLDRPIRLSSPPLDPEHSLIRQSTHASISAAACGLASTPAPVTRPAPGTDSQRHGSKVISRRKLPFKPPKTGEIGQQLTAISGYSQVASSQRTPFLHHEKARLASRRTETAVCYRVEQQHARTVTGHLAPFVALTR